MRHQRLPIASMTAYGPQRRSMLIQAGAWFAGATALHSPARAQPAFPTKTVTFIMPYTPGGLADATARRLAQRLESMWKVSVLVDNRPGAAGLLGAGIVAHGSNDGSQLLFTIPETLSITKAAHMNPGFDPIDDLQPLALVALSSVTLVVPGNSPYKTLDQFIDYARHNPGKLNFGVQGVGSGFHLALEEFKAMAGVDITAVPYKGAAPALADLLGGNVDAMMVSTSVTLPYLQGNKLRVLAIASKDRVPQLPQVPTLAESGLPGYDAPVALAVFARANTPRPIVDKISADIRRAMNEPSMVQWLADVSTVTTNLTPDEFKARIRADVARYQALIEKANIKFE